MLSKLLVERLKAIDKIFINVSGGRDSMVLLHLMLKYSPDNISVVNYEHGLRGVESESDSDFVLNYADENSVSAVMYRLKVKEYAAQNKLTVEQAARELRKAKNARIIADYKRFNPGKSVFIATAHHRGDNAESILMHIFRGSGLGGLTGMHLIDGATIRPLISFSSSEIDNYARLHSVPYRTDSTNNESRYTRNFLRLEVLPLLKTRFPAIENALLGLSETAADTLAALEPLSPKPQRANRGVNVEITNHSNAVSALAIEKALKAIGVTSNIERRHIRLIIAFSKGGAGKSLDLPDGVRVYKHGKLLHFEKNYDKIMEEQAWRGVGEYNFTDITVSVTACNNTLFGGETIFDLDKVPPTAMIRTRRKGDRFTRFKGGEKSLGDYMTDIKMPLYVRENTLILADGKTCLAIAGGEISDKIKIDGTTEHIGKLTVSPPVQQGDDYV